MLTGSQSPEAAPSLLQEDPNHQAQSGDQPGSQTVEQPTAETRRDQGSELPSASVRRLQSDTHSSTNAPTLVRLLQVSAVHRGDAERWGRGQDGENAQACARPIRNACLCFRSNHFDAGPDPDISLADMYRWKVSAYAPCSSTCTTGEPVDTPTLQPPTGLLVSASEQPDARPHSLV